MLKLGKFLPFDGSLGKRIHQIVVQSNPIVQPLLSRFGYLDAIVGHLSVTLFYRANALIEVSEIIGIGFANLTETIFDACSVLLLQNLLVAHNLRFNRLAILGELSFDLLRAILEPSVGRQNLREQIVVPPLPAIEPVSLGFDFEYGVLHRAIRIGGFG